MDNGLLGTGDFQSRDDFNFQSKLNSNNDEVNYFQDSPYDNCMIDCKYYDETDYISKFKNKRHVSLMSLNIQGIHSKFSEFSELITSLSNNNCNFEIIALQELFKVVDESCLELNGYHNLVYKCRQDHRGGGVGFLLSKDLKFTILEEISVFREKIFESLFLEVELPNKSKIIIGNIYRSPCLLNGLTSNQKLDIFLEILSNISDKISNMNKRCYLVGDFNLDLLKFNYHEKTSEFIDIMFASGYIEVINHPTRLSFNNNHTSSSLIDHIWTTNISNNFYSGILTTYISDHFIIFIDLSTKKSKEKSKTKLCRNFSDINIERFKENLSELSFQEVLEIEDAQGSYESFHQTFYGLFELHFPERYIKFNKNIHKIQSWMSKGLLKSRRTKIKLYKDFVKNPSEAKKIHFKTYKNLYNKLLKQMKKLVFSKQLIKHQGNLKKSWEIIQEASQLKKKKQDSPTSLVQEGKEYHCDSEMANIFNRHFTNVASVIRDKITPTDRPPDDFFTNSTTEFVMPELTPTSIIEIFSLLKEKNSLDYTGMSTSFIKKIIHEISVPLSHIFNNSLRTGSLPSEFKLAKVIPVFKKGGSKTNVNDYRPISLLPIFNKILEKAVAISLKDYLLNNNIIDQYQFGFLDKHSTSHPAVHLLNKISDAMNKNEFTIGIFCDLTKAFDLCPIDLALKKLNSIGISGITLQWFESYLKERKQFVQIGNEKSSTSNLSYGFPQGSILSPILFLIFFNDLPKSTQLFILLYCDDTTILASGSNLQELISFVNSELRNISVWFRANKMCLHPLKTKYTIFHSNPQSIPWNDIDLYIDENDPESTSYDPRLKQKLQYINHSSNIPAIRFLGIYFDPSLNFKYHVDQLCLKLSKAIFNLRRCKNLLTKKALISVYYSTFHCHLIHGILAYSCTTSNVLDRIVKQQKIAVRCISNSKYNAHTKPLFKKLGILPFDELTQFFKMKFMHAHKYNILPRSFTQVWRMNGTLNPRYRLRNDQDYHIPRFRTTLISRLPLISLPQTWNSYTQINLIKSEPMPHIFSKKMKKYLLDSIDESCNRLLCPICHLNL